MGHIVWFASSMASTWHYLDMMRSSWVCGKKPRLLLQMRSDCSKPWKSHVWGIKKNLAWTCVNLREPSVNDHNYAWTTIIMRERHDPKNHFFFYCVIFRISEKLINFVHNCILWAIWLESDTYVAYLYPLGWWHLGRKLPCSVLQRGPRGLLNFQLLDL